MQTVVATFDDRQTAEAAVTRLTQQGFTRDLIHLQAGPDPETALADHQAGVHTGFLAGIENFFESLFGGGSTAQAGTYAEAVRRGSSVVAVDAKNEAEVTKARTLLSGLGAVDVDQRAEQWKSGGWTGFNAKAKPLTSTELAAERQTVMPVVEEKLQVGKRTVEGGVVRVVKRVTDTPVSELVKLRDEKATIERRPVDRAATVADLATFKEGTIEVREMSEQAVVGKTARVVEEVVVGKSVTERDEKVSDTVRRTDVEVERVADGAGRGDSSTRTAGTLDVNRV